MAVAQFTGPKQGKKEKGPEEKYLNACSRCRKVECDCYSEAKGYQFCYKCGKPWKHHDVCKYNEKGLPGNTSYAAMNWEYPTPRPIYKSPSNSKELVWDHSVEGLKRTEAPIVKCAI